MKEADVVRKYHCPCPHCGHEQHLEFSRLLWDKDAGGDHLPATTEYACEACGAMIPESKKPWMLRNGRWVDGHLDPEDGSWSRADEPVDRPKQVGFHLNALYSPWMKWSEIVEGFLQAKNDPMRLQVWVNTVLGETFKEGGIRLDANPLLERREIYPADPVPEGVLLITAGVDIQADRLEVELVGWGLGEESWSLDYLRLEGDPTVEGGVWSTLDHVLGRQFQHPSGMKLKVYATAIDSGYLTQTVYGYCSERRGANVWPIKGVSGEGRPIWNRPQIRNKYKVPIYPVGVDTAKTTVMSHLRIDLPEDHQPGDTVPGYCHFPARQPYDEEYFRQLTSEVVVIRQSPNGYLKRVWVRRPGRRAETLDCRVYALSAYWGAFLGGVRLETIYHAMKNGGHQGPTRRVRSQGVGIG